MIETVSELLNGAIDIHAHAGPDVYPRGGDMLDVAAEGKGVGMRAIVFKDHHTMTADRAHLVNRMVSGFTCIGGIALSHSVGGLNPRAVKAAIDLGGKIVWLVSPIDAAWMVKQVYENGEAQWAKSLMRTYASEKGISVLKGGLDGSELLPEVEEILNLIAEANIVLDICHLSSKEREITVEAAQGIGVKKIILAHPNCSAGYASIDEQKELVKKGVYMTYAYLPVMPLFDREDPSEIVKMIREVGVEHSLLCTDFGQPVNPSIVEGMRLFISTLLMQGFSKEEVKMMAQENPAKLLF
jgi:hypothetical protein